ncbi:reprolysin-like metallopeptidase [Corallibacter vietnamensis]|uniref:zinc-dependent metalloprotease n=1 Tax=Corallibacter vietnamensis TaxID=904130 RepID=UPI0031D0E4B5
MKNNYTKCGLFLLAVIFTANFYGQNKSFWSKKDKSSFANKELTIRKTEPKKGDFYQLDITALRGRLESAPARLDNSRMTSNTIVDFPTANGNFESFRVAEASVLHPDLQAQFPELRSYVGQSIENPETIIRFSITNQGLHGMFLSSERGTEFIDPYSKDGRGYVVYAKRDLPNLEDGFVCEYVDDEHLDLESDFDVHAARNANDGNLRTFRLALACTVEYASFHWNEAGVPVLAPEADKKAAVLAAMVVTMTRVNGIYEKEFSITMELVPNNLDVIYINSDIYSNESGSAMLGQNTTVLNSVIGSANYDIGHVFSTGGGGIAALNSPCTSNKARGVTGLNAPVGDAFDIDYVCHEMGHQYGAPHTFNSISGNCGGGNRTASNAYEPGSGSTIMAYAGICTPDNVQSNSDAYFHQKSIQMIWSNVSIGNSTCGALSATGNSAPTAEAGADYYIPMSTPYKLTASSTDPDGTATHTYTWEQYDLGTAGVPSETTISGPVVRSFAGTTNPTRYIPNIPDLLESGGSTAWEKLVSVNRDLDFQVTVRDNDPRGGQTASDGMTATVTTTAGPFVVTSQNTDQIVWTPGQMETITWDVAGTNAGLIGESNVNILLSTSQNPDAEFTTVLASNVPNNGTYTITVPNVSAPYCRIMVEAVNGIFFNVNDNFFAIGNYSYVPGNVCQDYVFNAGILLEENGTSFSGYLLDITDNVTITDVNVSVDITTTNVDEIRTALRGPFETDGFHRLSWGGCDSSEDLIVTYDDEGNAIDCGNTNVGDSIIPTDALSFADGESSLGEWVFYVGDILVDGNRATWNSVTLTICEEGGFIPQLSTNEFSLEDSFSVYPNPNNGDFNIKLNAGNENVDVQVYDIRGRLVFNKGYKNTGAFNENINLGDVQAGMYLLQVKSGSKTVTKKIVVQ